MSAPTPVLIVNADDFGRTDAISRGIIRAHVEGIVTSTSLMVHGKAVAAAVAAAARYPMLSLGLHIEISDWRVIDGEWVEALHRADPEDSASLAVEVDDQIRRFVELVGRSPAHLDSHQHVHFDEPLRSIVVERAASLGVRVRRRTPGVAWCGDFFGQYGRAEPLHEQISVDALLAIIERAGPGTTEICCHPGEWPDPDADDYGIERSIELAALCDERVLSRLQGQNLGRVRQVVANEMDNTHVERTVDGYERP